LTIEMVLKKDLLPVRRFRLFRDRNFRKGHGLKYPCSRR